jgi:hypothetical protein
MSVVLREFRTSDRPNLREICKRTAVDRPVLPIIEDVELAARFFLDSYLACEPHSCFVAELEGQLVGYVVGTCDTLAYRKQELAYFRRTLITLMVRWLAGTLMGRYRRARSHRELLSRIMRTISGHVVRDRGLEQKVDLLRYPARCHLQVLPEARAYRVGVALFLRFQQHIAERGVAGQHARTYEREGAELYSGMLTALGFQTISKERDTSVLADDGRWIKKILVRDRTPSHNVTQSDG